MNLLLGNVEKSKAGRVVIVGSGVHNPEEAGGNVGSKATLGDLAGLKGGLTGNSCMVDGGKFDPDKAYKDSKLCNVITSAELARRLKKKGSKTTSNCMNPGLIPTTGLFREFNLLFVGVFTFLTRYVFKVAVSEEQGGERLAYMVASPELNGISGAYYSQTYLPKPPGYLPTPISAEAQDLKKASQLWALTEKLIKDNNK
ncbi:hypothetical protein B484DRAFT_451920 [Ochromonadaceae sp. CCMP2298]|nr:hypothetical protein B484DRAFT_451920 [Ochromonadaceae sp. CCMP2298]|mmetsp:Transcript_4783/g.10794  ORF Transcript_4783/g.10794 Transcript_4783/m.10794 type:complete len:200 (+) Transcript_4783:961-1560(+)